MDDHEMWDRISALSAEMRDMIEQDINTIYNMVKPEVKDRIITMLGGKND